MSKRAQQGSTLLEMIVVLVIIGLLMGLVGPRLFRQADKAKVQTAETQVKMLKGALMTMRLDIGRLPTEQEGLALLNAPPADERIKSFWKGPYLEGGVPLDPWNHPYNYSDKPSLDQPFVLYSLGADGQPGGDGDNADIGYLPRR
ncbi:type II secretion system major pseudopilin GspG [Pseudomonas triclosanedens]|uniref:type II secretion system major pseudopilin GspG n=1 Tax=Pseudomonas triclosanedens TaxID=2961893 RepID=UPI0020C439B7|nr:type II secretion system major pseudopilin GspG [Pseudomonas triclosanedens]MCP8470526.1 type II secretion system major pseudopilin GspG [Pseudomonas triclosanedens]